MPEPSTRTVRTTAPAGAVSASGAAATLDVVRWLVDLYRIAQRRAYGARRDELLNAILARVVQGFAATSGSLALIDEDGDALILVAGIGLAEGVVGQRIKLGEGILGAVVASNRPRLLNGDLSRSPDDARRTAGRRSPRPASAMCWPLRTEQKVIGGMSVNRSADLSSFRPEDLREGSVMVDVISIVLETLHLHESHQRQIQELERMNRELERTQAQLVQSEKLASVGQLAAAVAHEINNPMAYVKSNVNTLAEFVDGLLRLTDAYHSGDAEQIESVKGDIDLGYIRSDVRPVIQEAQEGIGRVQGIVRDLKFFSHMDSKSWELTDLHTCLDSTANIVRSELKQKKARLEKEYGELPLIWCQPSQLNQVFMNLLVNAVQAIEEGGEVVICTGVGAEPGWVFVEVSDNGAGIETMNLNHMFEPFFTTKPVNQGTGLGLSISRDIAERHGGRIELERIPGGGTCFRVWLPVKPPSDAASGDSQTD